LRDEAIALFRRGGELSRVHKEGGEKLFHKSGVFVCEEYGDNGDSTRNFTDAEGFLDHIWQRWYWKQGGTPGTPELTDIQAWQRIVHGLEASLHLAGRRPTTPEDVKAVAFYKRYQRLKMKIAIGIAVVVLVMALFLEAVGSVVEVQTVKTRIPGVAGVEDSGETLWMVETGIDGLQQILPDALFPAFIGTQPTTADKVPEPVISFVDTHSGTVRTESLQFDS